jgi:thiol:disulfide interchange protein DsbD
MAAFGIGFGLPFGLFSVFPTWLAGLPKYGGWMNTFKVTLGFLEIALAFKFLSNADLVRHWNILPREVFLVIWMAIFGTLAYYYFGRFKLPHDHLSEDEEAVPGKISVPQTLLGTLTLAFTLYLGLGLLGYPLEPLSGILPPTSSHAVSLIGGGSSTSQGTATDNSNPICSKNRKYADKLASHTPKGFCTFFDLEEAKAYAKEVKKPLFIDFTGHNCANCRKTEQSIWPDKIVRQLLTKEYVMVSLYVDDRTELPETITNAKGEKLRTIGDRWNDLQISTYNRTGQPLYILAHPDDVSNPLVEPRGYDSSVQDYIAFLKSGIEKYKTKN